MANPEGTRPRPVSSGAIRVAPLPAEQAPAQRPRATLRFLAAYLPFLTVLAALLLALYQWELRASGERPGGAAALERVVTVAIVLAVLLAVVVGIALAQRTRLVGSRASLARERKAQLAFFQRAADTLPVAVVVRGREGAITGVNRAAAEMFGRPAEELLGSDMTDVLAPDQLAHLREVDFKLRSGSPRESYDIRLAGSDGRERELSIHRAALLGEDGSYQGSVSAAVDVTELRETERRLARSEERFRALVESSPDVIGVIEGDGTISYASPSVEARLGWRPEELVGRRRHELAHPDDAERVAELTAIGESGRSEAPLRWRVRRRDGGYRVFESIAAELLDETRSRRFIVFSRDVTESVEAEERIAEARRTFEGVVEEMPALFVALDDDGAAVVWNREAERVTGLGKTEVLGRPDLLGLLVADPDYREVARRRFDLDRGGFRGLELEIVRRDGEHRVVAFSSVALRVPIRGWSTWMIGADVTAQRRAERDRAQAAAALERWSQRLVTLNQMDDLLLACSSLEEAYAAAQPFLARLLSASSGAYFRFDASRDLAAAVVTWGGLPAEQRTLAARDCWGVRLGRPHGFGSEAGELRCAHVDAGFTGRTFCVPALSAGELQGILHLRYDDGEDGAADLEGLRQLATSIAGHLAIRFSAIGLRDAYRRQSTRDPLTDLFNRRYMEETLTRELRRCLRARQPLAVLVMDLDHFKSINDSHGHEAGDAVLVQVAEVLRQHSRISDVACRAGGEEFVVVLPGMTEDGAIARAEAIRRAVADLRKQRSDPAFARLSTSIGVAVHPEHGEVAAELLRAADQALYRAKRAGRDRVELAASGADPS